LIQTEQDLLQYLMQGYILTCSNGKRYITFEHGNIVFVSNNESVKIWITIQDLYQLYKDGWKLFLNCDKWWRNIPEDGIWCWVSNIDKNRRDNIQKVFGCLEISDYYSFKTNFDSFKYAIPLTKENFNENVQW